MNSQFTAKDFNGFKYQRVISWKTDILKAYPELRRHKEFDPKLYKTMRLSHDKIFRYVLLVYTRNILFESIPSMVNRKREAALLAGFEPNSDTDTFSPDIERVLTCENQLVNKLIVLVIRLNKDSLWQQYCAFEEARANQIYKMIGGVDSKDKEQTSTLMDNIKKLSNHIDEIQADLLNQDEQLDLLELLYQGAVSENLGLRPEDIAQARKDGSLEKIIKNPYK